MRWAAWRSVGVATVLAVGVVGALHGVVDLLLVVALVLPGVVAWMIVPVSGRRGLTVMLGLVAILGGLLAWSRLSGDGVASPLVDWAIPAGLAGGAQSFAAIVRELVREPRATSTWRLASACAIVATVPVVLCCLGVGTTLRNDEYGLFPPGPPWRSHATLYEIEPLPSDVELVRWVCENPGAHGACNNAAIVAATDGVSGDALVDRLVDHYRAAGWPLEVRTDFPHLGHWGCRPVRGILPWRDHCMQITTAQHVSPWQTTSAPAKNEAIVYVNSWQEV